MDPAIKSIWDDLNAKTHTEQAVWFMNGFWHELDDKNKEMLWDIAHLFIEVGAGGVKKLYGKRQVEIKEGCDLDELQSHMVLEKLGETLTVRALRKRMEELDVDNNKRMSISEYLIAKFRKTPKELVNSPQGDGDEAELRKAQAMLDAAQEALSVAQEALENSKKEAAALAEAEAELAAAVAELKKEEDAFNSKIASLEAISNDDNLGAVKRNKAKNELAQMRSEDPMPLRRAKITQEAALKRVAKAKARAEAAVAAADVQREKAEAAVAEAKEFLRAVQARGGGTAQGAIWWMNRTLAEAERFMPRRR